MRKYLGNMPKKPEKNLFKHSDILPSDINILLKKFNFGVYIAFCDEALYCTCVSVYKNV
jgi:hypothetical protein